jgi:hypothetical protein
MEFSKTEELVVITSMKGTTTGEDLSEEVMKVLVTYGVPSIFGRSSGVFSLVTKDVKNTTNRI